MSKERPSAAEFWRCYFMAQYYLQMMEREFEKLQLVSQSELLEKAQPKAEGGSHEVRET